MGKADGQRKGASLILWSYLLIVLAAAGVVGAAGWYAYRYQKNLLRQRTLENLEGQAFYRGLLIRRWYVDLLEQTADAGRLEVFNPLRKERGEWSGLSNHERQAILSALRSLVQQDTFSGAALVDARGRVLPGCASGSAAFLGQQSLRALQGEGAGRPSRVGVFYEAKAHLLDLWEPLSGGSDGPGGTHLLLQTDPWVKLAPISNTYQTESLHSFQTSIIILSGGSYEVLNLPSAGSTEPAVVTVQSGKDPIMVRAISGRIEQGAMKDYRGVPVLYATAYVPFTDWGLVVKADEKDVYAALRGTALLAWATALLTFLSLASLAFAYWSRRHRVVSDELASLGLRYRSILETAQEGVWVWDAEGRTSFVNYRMREILGLPREGREDSSSDEFLTAQSGNLGQEAFTPKIPGTRVDREVMLVRRDGAEAWMSLALSSLYAPNGEFRGTLGLASDVTERHRAEAERGRLLDDLQAKRRLLESLVGRLMTAQEEERRRISHELHDDLVQYLVGAEMQLFGLERSLGLNYGDPSRDALEKARGHLSQAAIKARQLIAQMRPPDLERFGLAGALRRLTADLAPARMHLEVEGEDHLRSLPGEVTLALFRIAQEALQNVRKHAAAAEVWMSLRCSATQVTLEISDDGRGFDPGTDLPLHFGLQGMRERAQLAGGHFEIRSSRGKGTTVTARMEILGGGAAPPREETARGA
ncbi:MAG: PAS domain-containing sensor histidine kinase [Acidobacteriota bacterium]